MHDAMLINWWRELIGEVRRRFREIRRCPPCYKVGLDPLGPPGPDDVITANDRWRSPASGAPLTDLRAAKESFMAPTVDDVYEWYDHTTFIVHRRRDASTEQIDLRKEEIN